MNSHHVWSSRKALYRVFIEPLNISHTASSQSKLLYPLPSIQRHTQPQQTRAYAKYRPPVKRSQPWNEEIRSKIIHVAAGGQMGPPVTLWDTLRSFNRNTYNLVQVWSPPEDQSTETNSPDAESPENASQGSEPQSSNKRMPEYPICRIISKEELRAQEKAKSKQKKSPDDLTKELEINWAIDKNDLQHRLKKMAQFLEQGRRVEVLLARKKGGRQATPKEAESVTQIFRDKAKEVGGTEWRSMEGNLGMMAKLYFQGPKKKS
ncbi:MAG: hypothetical protein M1820_009618 [Bogoriella megaspora]|nr:MAG: hypothetical protein M1820_009618 [Bogoriella megaspora]